MNPAQAAYTLYANRNRIKRFLLWLALLTLSAAFILYLVLATIIAVLQGNGKVADGTVNPNLAQFAEFQSFSYKTIYGETWYDFKHPYAFPTLGSLTQGVILDSSAKVGRLHVAWDMADYEPRQTEVRAFADGTVAAVNSNILENTTRRWKFCDDNDYGICWYQVKEAADVQYGCGYEVIIVHADSLSSQYCHLATEPPLAVGDKVTAGQVIGLQGSTGWATGKHLHFALWRSSQPIDPAYAFTQTSLSDWQK
ncbi:MAG: M23 family metallopeptidase [Patescibacteria group bacterium]|nr:M23 family metallopeptidase [Patescibacteria group bacterium]